MAIVRLGSAKFSFQNLRCKLAIELLGPYGATHAVGEGVIRRYAKLGLFDS
jgi:hypothetical protein